MSSFCSAKATHIFFSKKFQHICVSLDVNFNESLTNDIVSFEQLGPELYQAYVIWSVLFVFLFERYYYYYYHYYLLLLLLLLLLLFVNFWYL